MFFWHPNKFDLPLAKTPKATYFVAAVCILVFMAQIVNEHYFEKGIQSFCVTYKDEAFFNFITAHLDPRSNEEECVDKIRYFHGGQEIDKDIWKSSRRTMIPPSFDKNQKEQAIKNIYTMYRKAYDASRKIVPINIKTYFKYRAGSYNPFRAITSMFLHYDIRHIGINLLLLVVFGSVAERVINSYLTYTIVFILSSLTIGFIYSLSNIYNPSLTQYGGSGVVSVMMGIAAYVISAGRIRSEYFFGLKARIISIPLLGLFLWFFSWDIYYLFSFEYTGTTNIAHVTGIVFGYLWARRYYKDDKDKLKTEIDNEYSRIRLNMVQKVGILEGIRKRK